MTTLYVKELDATINLEDARNHFEYNDSTWYFGETKFIEGEYPLFNSNNECVGNLESIVRRGNQHTVCINDTDYDTEVSYK